MPISADLGNTLEKYVSLLVDSGRYNSKSEVLREGVRLLQEREQRLAELDQAVAAGLKDIAEGRTVSEEEALTRLRRKFGASSQ